MAVVDKVLICFIGESFRKGGMWSRTTGTPDTIIEQEEAIRSHQKFIETLRDVQNVEVEVSIITYSTPYNDIIRKNYEDYNVTDFQFLSSCNKIGRDALYMMCKNKLSDRFSFALIIRIDLILKNYFNLLFNKRHNTLIYPFNSINVDGGQIFPGCPINYLSDTIIHIPGSLFSKLPNESILTHWAHTLLVEKYKFEPELITTFSDSFHDSNSSRDWNPIYYMAGRPRCLKWHACLILKRPILTDDDLFRYREIWKQYTEQTTETVLPVYGFIHKIRH